MSPLIADTVSAPDAIYSALATDEALGAHRAYVETLWSRFAPYADPDFQQQIACQFHPRFWEMYLACQLLDLAVDLQHRRPGLGPDLLAHVNGRHIWIEAIAPGHGSGPDAVPPLEEHEMFVPVPTDSFVLRLTGAVEKKAVEFNRYLDEAVVSPEDALVIALNGGDIWHGLFDDVVPNVVKALFGIGEYTVRFDGQGRVHSEGMAPRGAIKKRSQSPVSTRSFLDGSLPHIAAAIYSNIALFNRHQPNATRLLLLHNNPPRQLLKGWLGVGDDYWSEDAQIVRRRWPSCA